MVEVLHNKHQHPNLSSYLNSKYLLVSPYLEGGNFEKISGDSGDISARWRENKSSKLQRITRTLDAFQHFVVAKSQSQLLIVDLQGKNNSLHKS